MGVFALGREMDRILRPNFNLRNRLLGILDRAMLLESGLLPAMVRNPHDETLEEKKAVISTLKAGLVEGYPG